MSRWAPIHKQVSPSEIEGLLAEGLTRTEVCKRLEISYPTLLKLIGTDSKRKPYTRKAPMPEATLVYSTKPMTLQEAIEADTKRRQAEAAKQAQPKTLQNSPETPCETSVDKTPAGSTENGERGKIGGENTVYGLKRRKCEELQGEFFRFLVYSENEIRAFTMKALVLDADGLKRAARELMRAYTEIAGGKA